MSRFTPSELRYPIIQAPMAGGPSTPLLAAAASEAGGLGFLAAGYKSVEAFQRELVEVRSLLPGTAAFGVNLFAPPGHGAGVSDVPQYVRRLAAEAERRGVALGLPRWDDDSYEAKLDLLCAQPVPVVSVTFGCPSPAEVRRLHDVDTAVWVTITTVEEARSAQQAGADALVLQGVEAGGHRGSFEDTAPGDLGLLALLQLVEAALDDTLPLIATGGLCTGRGIAAVLVAGAAAAQLGTAFLLCPEAGTTSAHQEVVRHSDAPTALTRAFTGRTARGISNRFLREHTLHAPSAYPEIHHLTAPLRAAARAEADADGLHLWAGQTYSLARTAPAAEVIRQLAADTRTALKGASERRNASHLSSR
jgi:nitronate monooxygenase